MAISNPTTVAFCNEFIRPICDRWVGQNAVIDTKILQWFNTISVDPEWTAAASGDLIVDGSDLDGRTPISKADVTNVVTQLLTWQTQMNGAGVEGVIVKPHVNAQGL